VQDGLAKSGGASGLETCTDVDADKDEVRFHIRTRSFDKRAIAFRWEHGRYKLASIDLAAPVGDVATPAPKGTAKAKATGASKRAAPTSSTPRPRS
jgi:hypothetical protein